MDFGKQLARCCERLNTPVVIYLSGDLGAGKTTLARGIIRYFGFDKVKSPTYSLVESYQNAAIQIHHFDCYRLSNPEELNYIGIRDYANADIQLIEWANLGRGMIAAADLNIMLDGDFDTRIAKLTAHNQTGKTLLKCLSNF